MPVLAPPTPSGTGDLPQVWPKAPATPQHPPNLPKAADPADWARTMSSAEEQSQLQGQAVPAGEDVQPKLPKRYSTTQLEDNFT